MAHFTLITKYSRNIVPNPLLLTLILNCCYSLSFQFHTRTGPYYSSGSICDAGLHNNPQIYHPITINVTVKLDSWKDLPQHSKIKLQTIHYIYDVYKMYKLACCPTKTLIRPIRYEINPKKPGLPDGRRPVFPENSEIGTGYCVL